MKTRRLLSRLGTAFRLLRVDPPVFVLLLRMASWVLVLTVVMKILPLPRALQFMTWQPRHISSQQKIAPNKMVALLDRLLGLNFFVFTPSCWKRAIILHRYLALQGLATRIVFGVQRDDTKKLAGHAWLEYQGQPFFEAQTPEYFTTYSFPS